MNFEQFVRFCKDFGIFPDVLPKAKISTFFYTLSAIHTNSRTEENITEMDENTNCKKFLGQFFQNFD